MIIVLYVDYLLIIGSTLSSMSFIKNTLHEAFDMSDLGLLRNFFGLEITQYFDVIMIIQSNYVSYLIIKFSMVDCKETNFPFLSGISLKEGNSTPEVDSSIYRQLIESLLYLTHSRTDICYAMNDL